MPTKLWEKGKSANPNGRPKKDRALTAILETAGAKTLEDGDGTAIARRRWAADHVWRIVTEGYTTMPDGTVVRPRPRDYLETVRWLYGHIDGPPKQVVEQRGPADDGALVIRVEYASRDRDLAPPASGTASDHSDGSTI